MRTEPFFMTNDDWYYFDEKEFCYKLKENAPEEAIKSYQKFYEEESDEDWVIMR